MTSIVLGQYQDGEMVYKGHVTLGVGGKPFRADRGAAGNRRAALPGASG